MTRTVIATIQAHAPSSKEEQFASNGLLKPKISESITAPRPLPSITWAFGQTVIARTSSTPAASLSLLVSVTAARTRRCTQVFRVWCLGHQIRFALGSDFLDWGWVCMLVLYVCRLKTKPYLMVHISYLSFSPFVRPEDQTRLCCQTGCFISGSLDWFYCRASQWNWSRNMIIHIRNAVDHQCRNWCRWSWWHWSVACNGFRRTRDVDLVALTVWGIEAADLAVLHALLERDGVVVC